MIDLAPPTSQAGTARWSELLRQRRSALTGVAVFVALRAMGTTCFLVLLHEYKPLATRPREFGGGTPFGVLSSWDGLWYRAIATTGYHPSLTVPQGGPGREYSAAFFPLYPWTVRLLQLATPLDVLHAEFAVAVICSLFAAYGLALIGELLGNAKTGIALAALWALAPAGATEWAGYSESMFVALSVFTCIAAIKQRWLSAGILCLLAGLCRPTGLALALGVVASAAIAVYRDRENWLRPLCAALLAPLGFLAYVGWVGWRVGQLGGYFAIEKKGFSYYFDGGRFTLHATVRTMLGEPFWSAAPAEDLVAIFATVLSAVLLVIAVKKRMPIVVIAFAGVSLLLTLGSYRIYGTTGRYLMPGLALLMLPVADGLSRLSTRSLLLWLLPIAALSGWYAGFIPFELGVP